MTGRARRMEPVVRVMHERERAAARRLGEAQQRLSRRLAERERLEAYRVEYVRALQDGACLDGGRLRDYRVFLERIQQALAEADRRIAEARAEVEARRHDWLEARRREQSVDKAVARLRAAERRDEARREQHMLDEVASRRQR